MENKDKTLQNKAMQIKGKDYVMVKDRVSYFNETYPNGSIVLVPLTDIKDDMSVFKAVVTPDVENPKRRFIAHAREIKDDGYINKTSSLENAETSAIGRALAMMGIGVLDSMASADEVKTAQSGQEEKPNPREMITKKIEQCDNMNQLNKMEEWVKKSVKNNEPFIKQINEKRDEIMKDIPIIEE